MTATPSRHVESVASAARRYGVPEDVIMAHMQSDLFMAKHPRTGIWMVCGVLPENARLEGRNPFAFLWDGPETDGETFAWLLLSPIAIPMCIIKVIASVLKAYFEAVRDVQAIDSKRWQYESGGGLFDDVSTARQTDIDFLFGRNR